MSHGDETRERILKAGLELWPNVSARAIGRRLNMTHSAVLYHFGTAGILKMQIATFAVKSENGPIIAQLIAAKHPTTWYLTDEQCAKYMNLASIR